MENVRLEVKRPELLEVVMWVPTMSYCPARHDEVGKGCNGGIEREEASGVMIIKYTMNRGLYDGCGGRGGGKMR
jgi:hypothetical protein